MERPDIDGMKKRINAATGGPWEPDHDHKFIMGQAFIDPDWDWIVAGCECEEDSGVDRKDNAIFISNARTDLPECIAYIEYLESRILEPLEDPVGYDLDAEPLAEKFRKIMSKDKEDDVCDE